MVFWDWPAPLPMDGILFACAGMLGTLGITLISQAFRMANAAAVAPFDYTALVWASLFGWLVWGGLPDVWTCVGAVAIVGANVTLILTAAEVEGTVRSGRRFRIRPPGKHLET